MATKGEKSCLDIEAGTCRTSAAGEVDGGSLCFSDAEDRSWQSAYNSNYDEIDDVEELCRESYESDCSFEVDLETGDVKVNLEKLEQDCRICHLGLVSSAPESGIAIVLGCSCKEDLAAAHKQCAETWFKIKGNKTCEICGSTARNVVLAGEIELVEQHSTETSVSVAAPTQPNETRSFWQGHRFLNFLLACMVLAFVISWLFHFNVPG